MKHTPTAPTRSGEELADFAPAEHDAAHERCPRPSIQRWQHDLGQATAEYALVLLGAAAIALILLGWATGSGGGRIGGLLDHVIDAVTGKAK